MVCASLYVCLSAGVYADTQGSQKGCEIPPRTGVKDGCKPSRVGAENQTQVLSGVVISPVPSL